MGVRRASAVLALASVTLLGGPARADVLDLYELDMMAAMIACQESCRFAYPTFYETDCYPTCPAPAPDRADDWEKNNEPPIDRTDLHLATLEYWDNGSEIAFCYMDGAVVPRDACDLAYCDDVPQDAEPPPECVDWDGDGLPVALDPDDETVNTKCRDNSDCGFAGGCTYVASAGVSVCQARPCASDDSCTAFHLEQVAADNSEIIVHVHYDYSPVPATVLDLWIEYPDGALTLIDSRPLSALTASGKQLTVKHEPPRNGMARSRVVVLDTGSLVPIAYGAIAELVFLRAPNGGITEIAFASDAAHREHSMAPYQGSATAALREDALWGAAIAIPASERGRGDRLVLHYSFDNEAEPLTYADVPSSAELCRLLVGRSCDETDQVERTMLSRLGSLQSGLIGYSKSFDGVWREAAYLNGNDDHFELPLTLSSADIDEIMGTDADGNATAPDTRHKSLSLSFWLFPEPLDPLQATSGEEQVLFSHNSQAMPRETLWGLMLDPAQAVAGEVALCWFEGDATSTAVKSCFASLPFNAWAHIGMSLDGDLSSPTAGEVRVYVDGVATGGAPAFTTTLAQPAEALSCPQIGDHLLLETYQEATVLFASQRNNLYALQTVPSAGGAERDVLRAGDASFSDPDYSAVADKVVFVSTAESGNAEVWIADRDGTNRRPITHGFGDARRGIEARRPRWSWDASAIVFESNVYDPITGHNGRSRGFQLYFIGFDPVAGEPRVKLAGNLEPVTMLDYRTALGRGRPDTYAYWLVPNQLSGDGRTDFGPADTYGRNLTAAKGQYILPHWMLEEAPDHTLSGRLVATFADRDFRRQHVVELVRSGTPWSQTAAVSAFAPDVDSHDELFAGSLSDEGVVQMLAFDGDQMLLQQVVASLGTHPNYTVEVDDPGAGDRVTVSVLYTPTEPVPDCSDPATPLDDDLCLPGEIHDLLLELPDPDLILDTEATAAAFSELQQTNLGLSGKRLEVEVRQLTLGTNPMIVVGLRDDSPSPARLEAGAEVARLVLMAGSSTVRPVAALEPLRSARSGALFVASRDNASLAYAIEELDANQVPVRLATAAAFTRLIHSADGSVPAHAERFLHLAGLVDSRPVMLRVDLQSDSLASIRLDDVSERIAGLDWEKWEHYFPCNWAGGIRDDATGRLTRVYHGGIDELRVFNYVRSGLAFESEAARGHAVLDRERQHCPSGNATECPQHHRCIDGECVASNAPLCSGGKHSECPAYHLCVTGQCRVVGCDPTIDDDCVGGSCTLRPESVPAPAGANSDWICAVQCEADADCYTETCFNGPCGFCSSDMCVECVHTLSPGPFPQATVVGCPDANGFTCDAGSCVTGCYSFDGNEARFVCDPLLESCKRGECVPHVWDWTDISPATWAGSGHMHLEAGRYPKAIDTKVAIEFRAWGVGDYGRSPEVVVEGKASDSAPWERLGQVAVHHRSKQAAYGRPYRVLTTERPRWVRLRLVRSPWSRLASASWSPLTFTATGVVGGAGTARAGLHLCDPDVGVGSECAGNAPGSVANVGYRVDTGEVEIMSGCAENDAACIAQLAYLRSGSATVVILDPKNIRPYGVPAIQIANDVCAYTDGQDDRAGPCLGIEKPGCVERPPDPSVPGDTGVTCPVGDYPYCGLHTARRKLHFGELIERPSAGTVGGFAVLNCPYLGAAPQDPAAGLVLDFGAAAAAPLPPTLQRTTSTGIEVNENLVAETCTFTAPNVNVNGEVGYITRPCYEWYGGDASVDGANALPYAYHLLDLDRFSMFGGGAAATSGQDGDLGPGPCPASADPDGDGVCGLADNCPNVANGPDDQDNQSDSDGDGVGDACDPCPDVPDLDNDGVCDQGPDRDNCLGIANPDQTDSDNDGAGDACDPCPLDPGTGDDDDDGWCDSDNCPIVANGDQADSDGDDAGDACDPCPDQAGTQDPDNDGVCSDYCPPVPNPGGVYCDNCPGVANADQADFDDDGIGDACDACTSGSDADGDGVCDADDNCVNAFNPTQTNDDSDGMGNACDPCPYAATNDTDDDGVCDPWTVAGCDEATCGVADNCPMQANPTQSDFDQDGVGDFCDFCPTDYYNDPDQDTICTQDDNCPALYNPIGAGEDQQPMPDVPHDDLDGDGMWDACDLCPEEPGPVGGCPSMP